MTIRHLSQSIIGLLRNNPVGTLDFVLDNKGNPLSDAEARVRLNAMLEQGQKYLPTTDECVGFDSVKGCPGHEPLAGSDLTRAMLKRGDKAIMCGVGPNKSFFVLITGIEFGEFLTSTGAYYLDPVPVNNQGEPLTAQEVGL